MNIGENSDLQNEEYVINTIKNISKQISSLNNLYKKDNISKSFEETEKIQELQDSIEELVDDLEVDDEANISAYDTVSNLKDNNTLVISEKTDKVFLPYTVSELKAYISEYPDEYKTLSDVVNQEYIVPIERFKNQVTSRFRETYCLMRDIEMKSIIESFKMAFEVMFNSKLNPAIICACKSEAQLKQYIYCAEHNNLDAFNGFKIVFEVNPYVSQYNSFENMYVKKSRGRNKGKHCQ